MTLKLSTRTQDGVMIIDCNGRIVFGDESAMLREQVKALLPQNKNVVINLRNVSYIDSGGLGTLVGLYTSARALGGNIKLANLTARVGELLQVTKLYTVFDVYNSEADAVKSFREKSAVA